MICRATLVTALCMMLAQVETGWAQEPPRIPLVRGLAISSTLHDSTVDRESVVTVDQTSTAGVRYAWHWLEVGANGDTTQGTFARFVSRKDLADAPRWHEYFETRGPQEHPGYTAFTLSRAVYQRVRTQGSDSFQVMRVESPTGGLAQLGGLGGLFATPVRWRGTLTRVAANPEPFPLLLNGQRVAVPALRLQGRFTARGKQWEPKLWILADSEHPLLLKVVTGDVVFQTVRVDLLEGEVESGDETMASGEITAEADSGLLEGGPTALEGVGKSKGATGGAGVGTGVGNGAAAGGEGFRGSAAMIETKLATTCRVELPGVYFAFNSAALDPVSDRTIAALARMLGRHPDWKPTIEGHTDSIGSARANQLLSERRAEAVKDRLVSRYRIADEMLGAVGYGASRPREPNATIEGRARNRRVELVRECASVRSEERSRESGH
jgi:outer membrane protein OmpA-like peptidoglycan-associated protein